MRLCFILLSYTPLNEGDALASRILELGPAKVQFLGPVIIEVSKGTVA
jgi:hypothetical protein